MLSHMGKTAMLLQKFAEGETLNSIRRGNCVVSDFRRSPTTMSIYRDGVLMVSVSETGDCRFYDGVKIPGLEGVALEEGRNCPPKVGSLARKPRPSIVIPYPYPHGAPIDHDIRSHGDFESVVVGSRKVVVTSDRKYGQSGGKSKPKYDKLANPANPSESRTTGIRPIRSRAESGNKAELMRSGFTPIQEEPEVETRVRRIECTKLVSRKKKIGTKMRGKSGRVRLATREAMAMMVHKPCHVMIG